jgi:hypothetical protein
MKNGLFATIFILTFFNCKAADTLITRLINSVYLEEVDSTAKFYYLVDSAPNPQFDKYDLEELINEKEILKEIPLNDFILNIQNDTTKLYWKNFDLINAKCVDRRHLPHYSYAYRIFQYIPYNAKDSILKKLDTENIIPILVKPKMTKAALEKAREMAVEKYEGRPIEEKKWYFFSKPIFSNNREYVLISLNNNESGCLYIFKLVKSRWTRVFKYRCWVS